MWHRQKEVAAEAEVAEAAVAAVADLGDTMDRANPPILLFRLPFFVVTCVIGCNIFLSWQQKKFQEQWAEWIHRVEQSVWKNAATYERRHHHRHHQGHDDYDHAAFARNMEVAIRFRTEYADTSYSNFRNKNKLYASSGVLLFQKATDHDGIPSVAVRSGRGKDHDGEFVIEQEWISPTGHCFWIESVPCGRKAIIRGQFVNCQTFVHGRWISNNGYRGTFEEFKIITAPA